MNTYVESNFVLELVLQQEEVEACEKILDLAEAGEIGLCIPAYALLEPLETLHRRKARWGETSIQVRDQLIQFRRTGSLQADVALLEALTLKASRLATEREELVRKRVLAIARVISLDHNIFVDAENLRQRFGLTIPDAIMLASVLSDLASSQTTGIFVNRNTKDFDDPDIRAELKHRMCDVIWTFEAALGRIISVTGSG